MADHTVELVVLNWNGRDYLEMILPSVAAQTYGDVRVTVVDNGSDDDSLEYLRTQWPGVRVIELPENVGITAGLNVGIRASDARYIGLVNNDVELDPRWAELLVAALETHPRAGSVVGKLLKYDRRDLLDGAGDFLGPEGLWGRRGHGEPDRGQYDVPEEIDGASAAAALYRAEAFRTVGLLDEDLYAYYEDADWAFRARLAGYTCRYEPSAVAYHVGGASSSRRGDFEVFQCQRNAIALLAKNYPARRLLREGPRFLWHQAKLLVASLGDGSTRTRLRGWWAGLRLVPVMVRKRRDVFARTRPG